jgi:3-deoxy-manno-octulosonate cytidylyltransferase (CMP-KDO synthetase)
MQGRTLVHEVVSMRIIGIIPARMASSRFPGKPMADIVGTPMIGHVYLRSKMAKVLDDVYVATCDTEIHDYIKSIGGKAVMTGNHHERASDRAAEALLKIEKMEGYKADIVVMIQGDEPMLHPQMIEQAVEPMKKNPDIKVVNLLGKMNSINEFEDPNEVKVVVDNQNHALYFSREPIPSRKKGSKNVPMYKQICIIPFTRDFLLKYTDLKPTPLEIIESVDMLRVLEYGYHVHMVPTEYETYSVDTPQDLEEVSKLMKNDHLIQNYKRG